MQFVVENEMIIQQFGTFELALKLKKGSLALFPTDTLPAICSYPKYSKKIWTIKKRPSSKPLILMGACLDDMFEFFHRYLIQINNYQYLKIPLPVQQNLFQIQLNSFF